MKHGHSEDFKNTYILSKQLLLPITWEVYDISNKITFFYLKHGKDEILLLAYFM